MVERETYNMVEKGGGVAIEGGEEVLWMGRKGALWSRTCVAVEKEG